MSLALSACLVQRVGVHAGWPTPCVLVRVPPSSPAPLLPRIALPPARLHHHAPQESSGRLLCWQLLTCAPIACPPSPPRQAPPPCASPSCTASLTSPRCRRFEGTQRWSWTASAGSSGEPAGCSCSLLLILLPYCWPADVLTCCLAGAPACRRPCAHRPPSLPAALPCPSSHHACQAVQCGRAHGEGAAAGLPAAWLRPPTASLARLPAFRCAWRRLAASHAASHCSLCCCCCSPSLPPSYLSFLAGPHRRVSQPV